MWKTCAAEIQKEILCTIVGEYCVWYSMYELEGPRQGRSTRKAGWMHHVLTPLLVPGLTSHLDKVAHARGAPGWTWQGITGTFEKYIGFFPCLQSWDIHKCREKAMSAWNLGEVFLSYCTLHHGYLAAGQLFADGIVFQLVCPKWIMEPQKSLHWQHPSTNSPPGTRWHGASFLVWS